MFAGVIETESLVNPLILEEFTIVKEIVEDQPNADFKVWHINLVNIAEEKLPKVIEKISKQLKNGWYSIFWNNEIVYVVFQNKIFKLKKGNWTSKEFLEMKKYALKHGIQEEYLDFDKNLTFYNKLLLD